MKIERKMSARAAKWLLAVALVLVSLAAAAEAGKGRKPEDREGREAWLLRQRVLPGRAIPLQAFGRALELEAARLTPQAPQVAWESLGPDPILNVTMQGDGGMTYSGRALTVAVDPSDPQRILLGAASGGIWLSGDGGEHFRAVAEEMPSLAIKVIRFAPSDSSIVYAGSGEPHSKTSIWGMGVFKSLDGGRTWDALPSKGDGWSFQFLSVSGLQVDPNDPDIVYATTADVLPDRVDPFHPPPPPTTGPPAIYKSTDGGMTWTAKLWATDFRPYDYTAYDPYDASGWGFMDLELWKANPNVLFAVERSGGIYRSTDAGDTWELMTPYKNSQAGAAMGADFPAPVQRWHYYDGNTYQFNDYPALKRDIDVPEFNRIEISIGQYGGNLDGDVNHAVIYAGYGAELQLDVDGNGAFDSPPDIQAGVSLIFKSSDGGRTWRWLGDWMNGSTPAYCDAWDMGYENALYDNTVEVNPGDPDDVVVGGNCNYNMYWPDPIQNPTRYLAIPWMGTVYRTLDGGQNWMNITQACSGYVPDTSQGPIHGLPVYKCTSTPTKRTTHPDIHCAFYDWDSRKIYLTSDGGLSLCEVSGDGTDGLEDYTWRPLNNDLSTLQFFEFGPHPTDPNKIVGGMQDNANTYWNGLFWDAWDWSGGDGTVGRYDPVDPRHVYLGWQYALARNDAGGDNNANNWKILFNGSIGQNDTLPFVTIFEIDPVDSSILYVGSLTGLYRSADRGDHFANRLNAESIGEVTAISASPKNHNFVWVGTADGRVFLYDAKKGKFYEKTGKNFPNRWISGVEASANSAKRCTVSFSGYDANSEDRQNGGNGNAGKVFRTSDSGKHWKNISGNMDAAHGLDVPMACLAVDPKKENQLWVGTDTGVYSTGDGGQHWESYRGNMPVVAVMGLVANRTTGYLCCATFGRGVWRSPLK